MSIARTWAVALVGAEGQCVEVEADLSNQTPELRIIGLPDKALAEAGRRVHNACANSAAPLPRRRLTVNLSPASLPKHGSGFDIVSFSVLLVVLPRILKPMGREGSDRRNGPGLVPEDGDASGEDQDDDGGHRKFHIDRTHGGGED